jgi:hypothetical protein
MQQIYFYDSQYDRHFWTFQNTERMPHAAEHADLAALLPAATLARYAECGGASPAGRWRHPTRLHRSALGELLPVAAAAAAAGSSSPGAEAARQLVLLVLELFCGAGGLSYMEGKLKDAALHVRWAVDM